MLKEMLMHASRVRLAMLLLLAMLLPAAPGWAATTVTGFVGARTGAIGTLTIGDPVYGPTLVASSLVYFNGRWVTLARGTALFDVRFTHGGATRRFVVLRPQPAATGAPALMLLHGRGSDPEGMVALTATAGGVAASGYWAILPAGINGDWNQDPLTSTGVDDVGFIAKVVDITSGYFKLNARRVYAAGMSEGGFMTGRLACELSDRIAGFAAVAAAIAKGVSSSCAAAYPRTMLLFAGTADPIVPYSTAMVGALSVPDTFKFWMTRNNCVSSSTVSSALPNPVADGTTVSLQRNAGCGSGNEVRLYTVNNGGHTWPGGLQYLSESVIGKTTKDINALREIWTVLSAYSS